MLSVDAELGMLGAFWEFVGAVAGAFEFSVGVAALPSLP